MRTAIDLFAGAGGATQGLRDAGFDVVAAVENDHEAAETWRANHPGTMLERDVRQVSPDELLEIDALRGRRLDLLKACPPCQGFSSLRGGVTIDESRNDLVLDTMRFVTGLRPQALLMENVAGLRRDWRFVELKRRLTEAGYRCMDTVVEASQHAVPQRRRRLVLLALDASAAAHCSPASFHSRLVPQAFTITTAGEALDQLHSSIPVGDSWHRWRTSSERVTRRIAAIPLGGNRFDLPDELQLECHKRVKGRSGKIARSATASYGRVRIDDVAPTMTTRCTTPACGSFIHPTENRGLSLREAAAFQTFPPDYKWVGTYQSVERQIGNAVPVRLASVLGTAVIAQLPATER